MSDANVGALTHFSIAAPGTAIASYTNAMEYQSSTLKKLGTIIDTSGLRGTRSHASERTVPGNYTVAGTCVFDATPKLLDIWLPYILGGTPSGTTFPLSDAVSYFDVLHDKVAQRHVYGNCKVNKATFTSVSGQPLRMALDIVGETETVSATAFPTIVAPTDAPYTLHQLVGTLLSTSRIIKSIEVTIDNDMESRTNNSQTVTSIMPRDRIVIVKARTPYTSAELDLYGQALLGSSGSLVWTNGGCSCTFSFAALQAPDESPEVNDKGEIDLVQTYVARMSSTTRELIVTNDSTP